mmetsp:Transcript_30313/g.34559  ORF Transcript_30313/g.34559 Transcript_30313/m.34559 type:complete len:124 (+) Transcript_30313:505-876(+)
MVKRFELLWEIPNQILLALHRLLRYPAHGLVKIPPNDAIWLIIPINYVLPSVNGNLNYLVSGLLRTYLDAIWLKILLLYVKDNVVLIVLSSEAYKIETSNLKLKGKLIVNLGNNSDDFNLQLI